MERVGCRVYAQIYGASRAKHFFGRGRLVLDKPSRLQLFHKRHGQMIPLVMQADMKLVEMAVDTIRDGKEFIVGATLGDDTIF